MYEYPEETRDARRWAVMRSMEARSEGCCAASASAPGVGQEVTTSL